MLECVPNFSEGRDPKVVAAIAAAIQGTPGVVLLGHEMDSDHNRSVFTFAGEAAAVIEGAVRATEVAAARIDLSKHVGVHPRVGAADVIPFIPLDGSTMADAVAAAERAGQEIWQRLGVPIYFYGEAARRDSRKRLEGVRRKGFDGAPPDIGDVASHPTAGASVVGARQFLLAYNVDLTTPDLGIAQEIAKRVRASSGGFAHVKAMGLYLPSRQRAQVSMNLTNFFETPLEDVYQRISASANELGTTVADCEVIGFVPLQAFKRDPAFFARASNFTESRILENRLRQLAP
ncbi:MAG: glutamate formimidoyltransferase [Bryobacteraceae bacterium]